MFHVALIYDFVLDLCFIKGKKKAAWYSFISQRAALTKSEETQSYYVGLIRLFQAVYRRVKGLWFYHGCPEK